MKWPWQRRRDARPDWQGLVDAVDLAAAIAWGKEPKRWVVGGLWGEPYAPHGARVVADFYYGAVLAGNLDVEAVDGELFALDAALAERLR